MLDTAVIWEVMDNHLEPLASTINRLRVLSSAWT